MQSREQTTDHGVTEQTVGMQSRLQRMRDNADIKDTADTVDVADTVETTDTVANFAISPSILKKQK